MFTLLEDIAALIETGPIAMARVVSTTGAGPREVGATMLVTADGRPIGSLSAGCVEAVVIDTALSVIKLGMSATERFSYADADSVEIGLTCGGQVEVFIERLDHQHGEMIARMIDYRNAGQSITLVTTVTAAPERQLVTDADMTDRAHRADSELTPRFDAGHGGMFGATSAAAPRTFVHTYAPPPRMLLVGANDYVRAMSVTGSQLGYRVTVVDARSLFATPARFPEADEVVVDWPHRYIEREHAAGRIDFRTATCVMTHDSKFDVPALAALLRLDEIGFIGALGSRRTHMDRTARLRQVGITDLQLKQLHSPVGLDLGAHSPEETAISIVAQVLAERHAASGRALSDLDGPIHRR
ncbi:XdhC family protein [Rhodococcus sp. 06-235-1A]|uniref:XdhC family protein n=1 Tax=Rhodococcus sp. 06-235-1A TaxID=2022508 RepID=UPI0015C585A8|nr:XdhC/CoxI family protein [Rhodococcus sp. 06-235-1A]